MNLTDLADLLEARLRVIADHELREQDPDEQLRQLRTISEAIQSAHTTLGNSLDVRLRHYLSQASYQKALEHIRQQDQ